jgi:hypothetical protein
LRLTPPELAPIDHEAELFRSSATSNAFAAAGLIMAAIGITAFAVALRNVPGFVGQMQAAFVSALSLLAHPDEP